MQKRSASVLVSLAAIVLAGAGCTPAAKAPPPSPSVNAPIAPVRVVETGVRGVVLVGPTCPVERMPPDPSCAPKPLETDLVVTENGKEVARGRSGADGMFSFKLPPGKYRLSHPAGGPALPRVPDRDFTVTADGYAQVTLEADSGIR